MCTSRPPKVTPATATGPETRRDPAPGETRTHIVLALTTAGRLEDLENRLAAADVHFEADDA